MNIDSIFLNGIQFQKALNGQEVIDDRNKWINYYCLDTVSGLTNLGESPLNVALSYTQTPTFALEIYGETYYGFNCGTQAYGTQPLHTGFYLIKASDVQLGGVIKPCYINMREHLKHLQSLEVA